MRQCFLWHRFFPFLHSLVLEVDSVDELDEVVVSQVFPSWLGVVSLVFPSWLSVVSQVSCRCFLHLRFFFLQSLSEVPALSRSDHLNPDSSPVAVGPATTPALVNATLFGGGNLFN